MKWTPHSALKISNKASTFPKISPNSSLNGRNWSNIIESVYMWLNVEVLFRYAIHYNGFICNKFMKKDSCMDIEEIRSSSFRALKHIFMARKTYFLGHKFVWLFCGFLARWKNFQKLTKHPKVTLMPFVVNWNTFNTILMTFLRGLASAWCNSYQRRVSKAFAEKTSLKINKNSSQIFNNLCSESDYN